MNKYTARFLPTILFCVLLPRCVAQTPVARGPAVPNGGAILLDITGKIRVQSADGAALAIGRNGIVPRGAAIDTASNAKVLLRLEDGSEILLRENSHLVLQQETLPTGNTLFELIVGKLRAVVTKRYTGAPSFQLGTPSAIVAVRGTRFEVEVNTHQVTEVDVEQGLVQVTGRTAADPSVLLEPGFSTRVGSDRTPEPPVPTSRIRPDAREDRENKSRKNLRDTKGRGNRPTVITPESHQGTEAAEPKEPAEAPKPPSL